MDHKPNGYVGLRRVKDQGSAKNILVFLYIFAPAYWVVQEWVISHTSALSYRKMAPRGYQCNNQGRERHLSIPSWYRRLY
jgi:hypothetical protein